MNRDEILNMPAGREMDTLIVEKVMGLKVDYEFDEPHVPSLRDKYDEWGYLPNYSTDILAAWEVVEELKGLKPILNYDPQSQKWYMRLNGGSYCSADTAPLAICRVALLAVMEDEQ